MSKEWVATLQPGDEVAIIPGGHYAIPTIGKVKRRTPSGMVVIGHRTFNTDGRERALSYYRSHLEPVTEQHRILLERLRLVEMIEVWDPEKATLETLRAVVAVLEND